MPFGFAVEPDEYRMYSGCSASSGSASHSSSAASSASWYQTSRPSCMSQSAFVAWTTKMRSSDSRSPSVSSTCCLTGAVLPLRRAPSTVTSALAFETSMRSLTDSTLKPPNTTLCGAPIRAHASIATTTSGIIGRKIPTTSPFSMPLSLSALANRLTSRSRSAYVTSRSSPSSPRQWNATRSPLPASTWRSTQLWATLSLPPTNHFANGGLDQSSTWSHFSCQSSASACSAQKPSLSRSADSKLASSETFAWSRNSFGGSNDSTSSSSSSCASRVVPSAIPYSLHRSSPRAPVRGAPEEHCPTQWLLRAFSAPSPVSERTNSSWNERSAPRSVLSIVPSQQPMNPSGMETMPGLARVQPIGDPVSESAPGHTFGLTMTRKMALITPISTPVTAPTVLKRRQV